MKRFFCLAFLLLWSLPAFAQVPMTGAGKGAPSVAAYSGPGNITSGAVAFWGLRGYSAAYSTGSNPAVDLVDQAGANPITINILSNGSLDVASINTWVTAHTVTTIKVTKLYDQSGSANHLTQATLATMPTITLNAIGSLPALTFNGSQHLDLATFSTTLTQPYTGSVIAERTANPTSFQAVIGSNAGAVQMGFNNTSGNALLFAGAIATAPASPESAFHAMQLMANSPSIASIYVDGTPNTGLNASSSSLSGAVVMGSIGGNPFTGSVLEVGLWAGDQTAGNASMNSNQHTYWGF